MKINVLAVASALAVAATAVAQSPRFNVHALIEDDGDPLLFVGNSSPSIGALQAELDTSTMGRVALATAAWSRLASASATAPSSAAAMRVAVARRDSHRTIQ